MKTDTIVLGWRKDSYDRSMALAEMVAQELDLDAAEKNNLFGMTEETLSMQENIFGCHTGNFFFKIYDRSVELVIKMEEEIGEELKNVLIRMSSSQENEFKTPLLEKVSKYFKTIGPDDEIMDAFDGEKDKTLVLKTKDGEIWDESERAMLHHYADEIRIGVKKGKVVIRVLKEF